MALARKTESERVRVCRLNTNSHRRDAALGITRIIPARWLNSTFHYHPTVNYALLPDVHLGTMSVICQNCEAKTWTVESKSLCCSERKVQLSHLWEPPKILKSFLSGASSQCDNFLENSRRYNCAFMLTYFGANIITKSGYMLIFKVQWQIYYTIGTLLPPAGNKLQFVKLYFVADYMNQAERLTSFSPGTETQIVLELQENYCYIRSFTYDLKAATTPNSSVLIDTDKKPAVSHIGRFNAPTCKLLGLFMGNSTIDGTSWCSAGTVISRWSVRPTGSTHIFQYTFLFPEFMVRDGSFNPLNRARTISVTFL